MFCQYTHPWMYEHLRLICTCVRQGCAVICCPKQKQKKQNRQMQAGYQAQSQQYQAEGAVRTAPPTHPPRRTNSPPTILHTSSLGAGDVRGSLDCAQFPQPTRARVRQVPVAMAGIVPGSTITITIPPGGLTTGHSRDVQPCPLYPHASLWFGPQSPAQPRQVG